MGLGFRDNGNEQGNYYVVYWGYRGNGKEHGNYYYIGIYRDDGKENGNAFFMGYMYIMEKKMETTTADSSRSQSTMFLWLRILVRGT